MQIEKALDKMAELGLPKKCPSCAVPLKHTNLHKEDAYLWCPECCGYRRVLTRDEMYQLRSYTSKAAINFIKPLLDEHKDLYDLVSAAAYDNHITMNSMVRKILAAYFNERKGQQK